MNKSMMLIGEWPVTNNYWNVGRRGGDGGRLCG